MMLEQLSLMVQAQGLEIHGVLHPRRTPVTGLKTGTLVLLGTAGAFWPVFSASTEGQDNKPDPVDRWSTRVIGALAELVSAKAYFPFTGPPYAPFVNWALASGRAFSSPSQMMVHDQVGLMISYRGALHFDGEFDIPSPPLNRSPCDSCSDKPCLNTCPVGALVDGGPYDLEACHDFLDSDAGTSCMDQGCQARRACPLSSGANRDFSQSSHHMHYFHSL